MLFFMMSLTKHREFSVDFAHPIDPRLSAFLQSNASIDALSRCGALSMQPSDTDDSGDGAPDSAFASSKNASGHASRDAAVGRVSSSSSPSSTPPLISLLALSDEDRKPIAAQLTPASLHSSTNAAPSSGALHRDHDHVAAPNSSARVEGASHRADSDRPPPILLPSRPSAASSLSNPRTFAALEQQFIDMFDDSSGFEAKWRGTAGLNTSDVVSFSSCINWLQTNFPVMRNVEATRMAFERAAKGSDAFTVGRRSCDHMLPRSDLVDFLIRALYCHRCARAACFSRIPVSRRRPHTHLHMYTHEQAYKLLAGRVPRARRRRLRCSWQTRAAVLKYPRTHSLSLV
jgi:hypothetical protein